MHFEIFSSMTMKMNTHYHPVMKSLICIVPFVAFIYLYFVDYQNADTPRCVADTFLLYTSEGRFSHTMEQICPLYIPHILHSPADMDHCNIVDMALCI